LAAESALRLTETGGREELLRVEVGRKLSSGGVKREQVGKHVLIAVGLRALGIRLDGRVRLGVSGVGGASGLLLGFLLLLLLLQVLQQLVECGAVIVLFLVALRALLGLLAETSGLVVV
jgi:hypothetical protein